jgi:hypothetical protein
MIVLITPTGGRPIQFNFCKHFMKNQTYKGEVTWVIVDDCLPVTTFVESKWNIINLFPRPVWQFGMNTQGRNIQAALDELPKIKDIEAIFIIEDDDYYKSIYLERMVERLKGFEVAGEINTIYYNVPYNLYVINPNTKHSSLFQTCFTPSALPVFQSCLKDKFIDYVFFSKIKNVNLFNEGNLAIGMKGMAGRGGIGAGHKRDLFGRTGHEDRNMIWLRSQIGEDISLYLKYNNENNLITHSSFRR